jgi:hypothetical protein
MRLVGCRAGLAAFVRGGEPHAVALDALGLITADLLEHRQSLNTTLIGLLP